MAINISVGLKTSLQQTLTPQQIQYLKILQMPLIQFEQEIKREVDENPLLDLDEDNYDDSNEIEQFNATPESDTPNISNEYDLIESANSNDYNDEYADSNIYFEDIKNMTESPLSNYVAGEDEDPYHLYTLMLQDDAELSTSPKSNYDDDDDSPSFQIKSPVNFLEELEKQLSLFYLSEEELLLGKHILWNVDEDGYLRRELNDIAKETNSHIAEMNFETQKNLFIQNSTLKAKLIKKNPAYKYLIDDTSKSLLGSILIDKPELINELSADFLKFSFDKINTMLKPVNLEQAEKVLKIIQSLDPPGIASRNIQECLISQLKIVQNPTYAQSNALRLLQNAFEEFSRKHFKDVQKVLNINDDDLKDAIEVIKKLNPKPGEGISFSEVNTVIPDFVIELDEKNYEPQVILNDSTIPPIRINDLYESLKRESKEKKYNKETKQWIRSKYEDAKFLIQAIQQRKITMLKIMVAIAGIQKDFFLYGPENVKPMIYKDISDVTGMDISTVCRIVNNKFVQSPYGTFELKSFFSESLPNDDGEEVSTTVIKQKIKEMIDKEDKNKTISDDQIAKNLKDEGYNVARRTVAKYREQMKIPVARLRKELL